MARLTERQIGLLIGVPIAVVFVAAVVVGVLAPDVGLLRSEKSNESASAVNDTDVTDAKYGRIASGMPYEDVRDLIGKAGDEQSETQMDGTRLMTHMWKNSNGSRVVCTFRNGRLYSKSRFGTLP